MYTGYINCRDSPGEIRKRPAKPQVEPKILSDCNSSPPLLTEPPKYLVFFFFFFFFFFLFIYLLIFIYIYIYIYFFPLLLCCFFAFLLFAFFSASWLYPHLPLQHLTPRRKVAIAMKEAALSLKALIRAVRMQPSRNSSGSNREENGLEAPEKASPLDVEAKSSDKQQASNKESGVAEIQATTAIWGKRGRWLVIAG